MDVEVAFSFAQKSVYEVSKYLKTIACGRVGQCLTKNMDRK